MQKNTESGHTQSDDAPSLMRIVDVARTLNISVRSVWRLIGAGALRSVKCFRSSRIERRSVDAFIARGGTK